jgi:hypothetical protein
MPDSVSALNRVDLPTFGSPTIPHFKLMAMSREGFGIECRSVQVRERAAAGPEDSRFADEGVTRRATLPMASGARAAVTRRADRQPGPRGPRPDATAAGPHPDDLEQPADRGARGLRMQR